MSQILQKHDFSFTKCKFHPNQICDKLMLLQNYTITYTILVKYPINTFLNTLLNKQKNILPLISLNFFTQKSEKATMKRIYNQTLYVWSNKFTPAMKILHKIAGCDG